MNIETANRLYELRKKNNLSQEELADKLGISRQAVSKWERAEASPDTDNLILLAKLYGVSLDDLLNMETSSKYEEENPATEEPKEYKAPTSDSIAVSDGGVHIESEDGETVIINKSGVTTIDKDGKVESHSMKDLKEKKTTPLEDAIYGVAALTAVIAYLILGFTLVDGWVVYWPIFILIPVVGSIPEAIRKKKFTEFIYPCLVTAVYCFLGMKFGLWHPYWILFITIPVYYMVFSPIDNLLHKNDPDYDKDNDDEDKDE